MRRRRLSARLRLSSSRLVKMLADDAVEILAAKGVGERQLALETMGVE